jgi:hypothetical protein
LQRLLSALCDGRLDDAQHARLEQLLGADAECRRLYLEYVDLHARLLVHPRLPGGEPLPPPERRPGRPAAEPTPAAAPPAPRRRAPQALRYAVVAAATMAASLLVQLFWLRHQPPEANPDVGPGPGGARPPAAGYVATLTQAADCVWAEPDQTRPVGSRLPTGVLRLRRGIARVRFDSGPDLVIEGPAELRLDSATSAAVLRGKVVFRADETAAPFDLRTPSATLVDLGTEYAVAVGPDGEEVHVFDGAVERTPLTEAGPARTETLTAGEARRYGPSPASAGRPTELDPQRFVRRLAARPRPAGDPAAGLLAYEGFDYADPQALDGGKADGGAGWAGPWRAGFARPIDPGAPLGPALNVKEGLSRAGASAPAVGGAFDYTGFAKYFRRLQTPVRLDADGVYYLSFLFRRHGPQADPLNAVAVLLRTDEELERELQKKDADHRQRLNLGVDQSNHLFTHLQRVGARTPLPLSYGQTYLLVAKIVASRSHADQVYMRVYGPDEPVEREEPTSWSLVGPPYESDLVFDWLEVHINSKTRQTLDEIRVGATWASATAPWIADPGPGKEGAPSPPSD